ncbi:hypothetical protein B0T14DRAFT_193416 [Immersiella caudata]|uniref:Heterokaryon incompatibility domain-containing protein n=1 Tax=Immersiella caudata TaxID=314043 RepID=A0AA40C3X1_9PEZI|nr:hypothetical protein B0T14DRAFT_193416 [Immersiella caudata]
MRAHLTRPTTPSPRSSMSLWSTPERPAAVRSDSWTCRPPGQRMHPFISIRDVSRPRQTRAQSNLTHVGWRKRRQRPMCSRVHRTVLGRTGSNKQLRRHARRLKSTRALWVDAICINQLDKTEEASQIPKMLVISSEASRAVVFLGETTVGTATGRFPVRRGIESLVNTGSPSVS